MCCPTCKVPVFQVERRSHIRLVHSGEERPQSDVPRDKYGRPLQKQPQKQPQKAVAKFGFETGRPDGRGKK